MQIDKVVNTIKSESSGFYLLETTNSESISYLEEQILNSFYEKQYEIDTSFIILEPEEKSKFITIDQIRKMKKEFLHTNVLNLNKVIFVREVNYLNINALNGLLKIIEEIPSKTYFIFCSSNLNLISFLNSVCFLGNRVTLTPAPKNFTIVEYGLEKSEMLGQSALTWPPRLPFLSSAAIAISSAVSIMFSSSRYSIKP